jgi:hypothetical protein
MQVISTVVGWQQPIGMFRVADQSVEIDDCIEMALGANPSRGHSAVLELAGTFPNSPPNVAPEE